MQRSLRLKHAGVGRLAYSAGLAECLDVLGHAGPPVPTSKVIVRFPGGFMTDNTMGLVYCYLGYPPPLGKRARDCNNWVTHGVLEVRTPSRMA